MHTRTKTTATSPLIETAHALIQYAHAHPQFGVTLADTYRERATNAGTHAPIYVSPYRMPQSQQDAERLLAYIRLCEVQGVSEDYATASAVLAAWSQSFESPKNLIFGVVGVDIIGPTLGLIQSKKKKNPSMRLVIDAAHYQRLSKKELITLVSSATGTQFATELRAARGNAFLLHPDTADWCFGEHTIEIFTEDAQALRETCSLLSTESLPHTELLYDTRKIGVVLSPQIDESFVMDRECARVA